VLGASAYFGFAVGLWRLIGLILSFYLSFLFATVSYTELWPILAKAMPWAHLPTLEAVSFVGAYLAAFVFMAWLVFRFIPGLGIPSMPMLLDRLMGALVGFLSSLLGMMFGMSVMATVLAFLSYSPLALLFPPGSLPFLVGSIEASRMAQLLLATLPKVSALFSVLASRPLPDFLVPPGR
jgi:uncharacterized membrane protein required for colicin V production